MKKTIIFILAALFISTNAFARQPQKGYRGFIDWTNDIRSESDGELRATWWYTGLSTSHGYQWNPWLFTGAGIDLQYHPGTGSGIAAVFFQGRTDLKFGKFTPFGDMRLGYSCTDGGGVYFSPNIGYRFNWGRKMGVNIGAGITVISGKTDLYEIEYDPDMDWWDAHLVGKKNCVSTIFSFKIGIDF